MPTSIGAIHNHIIRKFYQDGVGRNLKKSRALVARTAHGYLFPLKVRIDFYHHFRYGYSFIVFAERLKQFNLYQEENIKISIEEALLLMVDEQLNVTDYSANIFSFPGLQSHQLEKNLEMSGHIENLVNIIPDA